MTPRYPAGFAQQLIASDLVTPATRAALTARLETQYRDAPRVLTAPEFETLRAVASRLLPQSDRTRAIDIAGDIDARLARNDSKGWRYAALPPEAEMYSVGLRAFEESSVRAYGVPFHALADNLKDELLSAVQRGNAGGEEWQELNCGLFFEEMLAEMVECYFSHPLAMEEIGYAGFADAAGWQQLGLDNLAPHEPRPL